MSPAAKTRRLVGLRRPAVGGDAAPDRPGRRRPPAPALQVRPPPGGDQQMAAGDAHAVGQDQRRTGLDGDDRGALAACTTPLSAAAPGAAPPPAPGPRAPAMRRRLDQRDAAAQRGVRGPSRARPAPPPRISRCAGRGSAGEQVSLVSGAAVQAGDRRHGGAAAGGDDDAPRGQAPAVDASVSGARKRASPRSTSAPRAR